MPTAFLIYTPKNIYLKKYPFLMQIYFKKKSNFNTQPKIPLNQRLRFVPKIIIPQEMHYSCKRFNNSSRARRDVFWSLSGVSLPRAVAAEGCVWVLFSCLPVTLFRAVVCILSQCCHKSDCIFKYKSKTKG